MTEIVLSLCDRTGNALIPWANDGYDCIAVDTAHTGDRVEKYGDGSIRFVESDVREFEPPTGEYRIGFGWPPCTHLAGSGARWWKGKGLSKLAEAIGLVAACKEILSELGTPWMVENPVGALSTHWREPDYLFDPFEYNGFADENEAYTKRTCLWTGGGFRMPSTDTGGVSRSDADDRIHKMPPSDGRADLRSATPVGFARAVFLAHEEGLPTRDGCIEQETLATHTTS